MSHTGAPPAGPAIKLLNTADPAHTALKLILKLTDTGRAVSRYSITPLARISSVRGTVRPIVLVALRLMTSSIVAVSGTGRSIYCEFMIKLLNILDFHFELKLDALEVLAGPYRFKTGQPRSGCCPSLPIACGNAYSTRDLRNDRSHLEKSPLCA